MGHLHNLHKNRKPAMLSSIGNKVKSALEIAAAGKGLFDIGRSVYQGISTYGPMIMNGVRTIGPMVAAAAI